MQSCHKNTVKSSHHLPSAQAGSSSQMHESPFHGNSGHMPGCLQGAEDKKYTVKKTGHFEDSEIILNLKRSVFQHTFIRC